MSWHLLLNQSWPVMSEELDSSSILKHDAHWIKPEMVLKNIQSCPLPAGSRSSEAKLTEQRISCAPQRARNVSHGFSFPLLWRVNHQWGCNARQWEQTNREREGERDRGRPEVQWIEGEGVVGWWGQLAEICCWCLLCCRLAFPMLG